MTDVKQPPSAEVQDAMKEVRAEIELAALDSLTPVSVVSPGPRDFFFYLLLWHTHAYEERS